MSHSSPPKNGNASKIILTGCVLVGLLVFGAVIVGIVSINRYLKSHPLFERTGPEAFENEPGPIAQQKLPHNWPQNVDPAKVASVSFKAGDSIDSHSYWYRPELGPAEAKAWEDAVHARLAAAAISSNQWTAPEGITRTLQGAIPLRRQIGATPTWWSPPDGTIRATEVMSWYTNGDSGDGMAIYSIYDEANGVLWLYDYSAQHDRLWEPGELPADGKMIGKPAEAEEPAGEELLNGGGRSKRQIRLIPLFRDLWAPLSQWFPPRAGRHKLVCLPGSKFCLWSIFRAWNVCDRSAMGRRSQGEARRPTHGQA